MDARTEMIEQIRSEIAMLKLFPQVTVTKERVTDLEKQLARLEAPKPRNDQADFVALLGAFGGKR